ncbi:SH3 domain-containing protein [Clostridium hydrogeniformans]|uniref:SH3 domain-containing protein n=1 Tax=Clostridium hydrogeniformans TaxID=349933 RepID=UPI000488E7DE|nr:SH3 domain-containing protein [Clostridium hydrogeniformans]
MKKRILLSTLGLITILSVGSAFPAKADTLKNNNIIEHKNSIIAVRSQYPGIIIGTEVRLRAEAGTSSRVIRYLNLNEKVSILESQVKEVDGYKWDKIRTYNGEVGYVASQYVAIRTV